METGVASESYYTVLGLNTASSNDEIRRAYRKLAMQWHPDKWANNTTMLGEAKRKFQKIQEAYAVLSDPRKRTLYDVGMYDPSEEDDEGFCDFMQELVSLMSQVREEEKSNSMEDLQCMFAELVRGFQSPQWFASPLVASNQGCSGKLQHQAEGFQSPQWFASPLVASNQGCSGKLQHQAEAMRQESATRGSSFGVFRMSSYCR